MGIIRSMQKRNNNIMDDRCKHDLYPINCINLFVSIILWMLNCVSCFPNAVSKMNELVIREVSYMYGKVNWSSK